MGTKIPKKNKKAGKEKEVDTKEEHLELEEGTEDAPEVQSTIAKEYTNLPKVKAMPEKMNKRTKK